MLRGKKTDREKDHCCNNHGITKSDRFDPSWLNYDVITTGWKRRRTAGAGNGYFPVSGAHPAVITPQSVLPIPSLLRAEKRQ